MASQKTRAASWNGGGDAGASSKTRLLVGGPGSRRGDAALYGALSRAGRPKYSSIIRSVCLFILITECCERIAYYGLTGSLPIYFHKNLGFSKDFGTELSSLFSSVNYMTPLVGAYIADVYLGRYSTIFYFCIVYVAGMSACVAASWPSFLQDPSTRPGAIALFVGGLFGGVAVGAGGIKPNVVTLGADQFDISDPQQAAEKDRFFSMFYWCINIGATFSYGYLTGLAVNGQAPFIPVEYGFFASFLIPAVAMALAFVVFLLGSSRYIKLPPSSSAFARFSSIFCAAGKRSRQGRCILGGLIATGAGVVLTICGFFVPPSKSGHTPPANSTEPLASSPGVAGDAHTILAIGGMALIITGLVLLITCAQTSDWIRNYGRYLEVTHEARRASIRPEDVRDAAEVARLLPYLAFITIFWACYGQMNNNFVIQGCQMDLREWFGGGQVSSAFLSLFDSLVIMIFIPIFDVVIYPTITRCRGGRPLSLMQKIGAGFVFCFLSMVTAGALEVLRKSRPLVPVSACCGADPSCDPSCADNSGCAPDGSVEEMRSLSIWWASIQYLLIGMGEILTSISSYELFYSQVPASMRSVCQGLNLLTTSIGFMLTGGVNSIFSFWIPNNLDNGHLEYVYWVVAAITAANLVIYIYVSQGFRYSDPSRGDDPVEQPTETGMSPDMSRHPYQVRRTRALIKSRTASSHV